MSESEIRTLNAEYGRGQTADAAALAQYPQITDEAKHLIDSLENRWKEHSDSAWQVAFPIVIK